MSILNKVFRIKNRTVVLDGSIERRPRSAFDIIQDTEATQTLRSLIFDKEDSFNTFKNAISFNYAKNKLALGIQLEDEIDSIPTEYFESICFALFNSAADRNCISLRTTAGYTTSRCNAFPFAMFYIFIDSELRKVEKSSYSGDKYIASMLLKTRDSLYELIHRCLDKELKMFIGSTLHTFEATDTKAEYQERSIYVIDTLSSTYNNEEIVTKFEELKSSK